MHEKRKVKTSPCRRVRPLTPHTRPGCSCCENDNDDDGEDDSDDGHEDDADGTLSHNFETLVTWEMFMHCQIAPKELAIGDLTMILLDLCEKN